MKFSRCSHHLETSFENSFGLWGHPEVIWGHIGINFLTCLKLLEYYFHLEVIFPLYFQGSSRVIQGSSEVLSCNDCTSRWSQKQVRLVVQEPPFLLETECLYLFLRIAKAKSVWFSCLHSYHPSKTYVLRSSGMSRKLAALIVRYSQKKKCISIVFYCSEHPSIAHNLGTTGPIQVGLSAKCTSLSIK